MKHLFRIVAVVTATTMMVGCNNMGEEISFGAEKQLTVDLSDSRTSLGASENGRRAVYWSEGDCIAANGISSTKTSIDATNRSKAVFSFSSDLSYPCNILYPASFYKDNTTITLPNTQPEAIDTFASNTLPMATYIADEGEAPCLHHLAGVIHLQIKVAPGYEDRAYKLLKVEFKGNNDEPVAGDFTINYEDASITPAEGGKVYSTVSAVVANGELSEGEVKHIYIVVPAQEYANGFRVRIIDKEGRFMDKTKGSAEVIERGEVLKMPLLEFAHTGHIIIAGM